MFDPTVIKAIAETHSEAELSAAISRATHELTENPDLIVSASSGGGTSYARTERLRLTEQITLYSRALAYKQGDPSALDMSVSAQVVFTNQHS